MKISKEDFDALCPNPYLSNWFGKNLSQGGECKAIIHRMLEECGFHYAGWFLNRLPKSNKKYTNIEKIGEDVVILNIFSGGVISVVSDIKTEDGDIVALDSIDCNNISSGGTIVTFGIINTRGDICANKDYGIFSGIGKTNGSCIFLNTVKSAREPDDIVYGNWSQDVDRWDTGV